MTATVKLSFRDDQIGFIEQSLMLVVALCLDEASGATRMRKFTAERTKERAEEILAIIRES